MVLLVLICSKGELLDLLLVALNLALELVNQSLHALMVLLVLICSKGELLDGTLRFAEILANISISAAFSIQFGLQLSNTSLHLNHGLSSSLQCVDFCFISTGTCILALGLKKFLILLKSHGNILLTAQFICKAGSINHCSSSFVFRKSCLIGHLIKISPQLVKFCFKLPLSSINGLVDISQVSKCFICISKFLFS